MKRHLPAILLLFIPYALLVFSYGGDIQWGDGLEFVAVSQHLGIAHPPGYPTFTMLGWLAMKILPLEPYRAVLLVCQLATILAAVGVYTAMVTLQREKTKYPLIAMLVTGIFAFGFPMLETCYAIEVYSLNAALLIVTAALLIPQDGIPSFRRRLAAAVTLGIAASNHLSSVSLGPLLLGLCFLAWRENKKLIEFLPVFLAPLITICLYSSLFLRGELFRDYGIFWGSFQTIPQMLEHVRGGEYRSFQFLMQSPGQPFTGATYLDFLKGRIVDVQLAAGSFVAPLGNAVTALLGFLLAVAAVGFGLFVTLRGADIPKRFWFGGVMISVALQSIFIFTYNIPDIGDYFIGIFVLLTPVVYIIMVSLTELSDRIRIAILALLAVALLTVPFRIPTGNPEGDIPRQYLNRLVAALPEGASLITGADADIYSIWYLQFVEKERLDIVAIGTGFMRFPWVRATIPVDDPRRNAIGLESKPPPGIFVFVRDFETKLANPLLEHGPVYTTFSAPEVLTMLERSYLIEPVAQLLTEEEIAVIMEAGLINVPPPILYRLEPIQ